jgi:hypothetical protein
VRALSHVFFFSTLVRCGEYRSQTGIQRKLNFVSVRTIKEGSSSCFGDVREMRKDDYEVVAPLSLVRVVLLNTQV